MKEHGVIALRVHRNPDNPNSVMLCHQFADRDSLNGFFNLMDASQEVFKAAGVLTTEMTWFGEDVIEW